MKKDKAIELLLIAAMFFCAIVQAVVLFRP